MSYQTEPATSVQPDTDAKNIRQRLIGLSESFAAAQQQLEMTRERWWGASPKAVSDKATPPNEGDNFRGIWQLLDELQDRAADLNATAESFTRLA